MDKLERHLTTVGVSGKAEVNSQLGRAVESVGVVAEQNVSRAGRHQAVHTLKVLAHQALATWSHWGARLVVHSEQVDEFTPGPY